MKKRKVTLVGPFVGELFWELFRFAPYVIGLKKSDLRKNFIVLSREERFDLYGQYASIFVPLRIKDDSKLTQECFRLKDLNIDLYKYLTKTFRDSFKERFEIEDHIYPDVGWRYRLKWQFPREKMDYDFKPREENGKFVDRSINDFKKLILVEEIKPEYIEYLNSKNYHVIEIKSIESFLQKNCLENVTFLGVAIELLKRCDFVVSKIDTILGKMSLLIKKPLIVIKEEIDMDSINLINPFRTKIISCRELEDGVEYYENNF